MKRFCYFLILIAFFGYLLVPVASLVEGNRQEQYRLDISMELPPPNAKTAPTPAPSPSDPTWGIDTHGLGAFTCPTAPTKTVEKDGSEMVQCNTTESMPTAKANPALIAQILEEERNDARLATTFEEWDIAVSTVLLLIGVSPFVFGSRSRDNSK